MARHRIVRSRAFQERDDCYDDMSDFSDDNDGATEAYEANDYIAFDYEKALPALSDDDRATMMSIVDQLYDILGDKLPEQQLQWIVLNNEYDLSASMDAALNAASRITPPAAAAVTVTKKPAASKKATAKPKAAAANENKPKMLPKNSRKSTVEADASSTVPTSTPPTPATYTKAQATRNVHALFDSERGALKASLNMVVVGHVDAGKSTLMGHTLLDLGEVSKRTMHGYERDSQKMGKASFKFAWVLDETGEERERGITMDVGSVRFETETKAITLLDAPGHKDFIPNMISGASQADVALLVVDATRGEFESGFDQGGQTREHAILVRSLGVTQLVVVVNKLDTVEWSKKRFNEILDKLRPFLLTVGFETENVRYVPVSGLTGENLVHAAKEPALTVWYGHEGPTLAQAIDAFDVPQRSIDKPFRMTISDAFKMAGTGYRLAGRIESGALAAGDRIYVCPNKEAATVKAVYIDEVSRPTVFAGDHVTVTLTGIETSAVLPGSVLCDVLRPIPVVVRFQARIVVFDVDCPPLTVGSPLLLHHASLMEPVEMAKIRARLDKQTGVVLKKGPRFLVGGDCALVVLQAARTLCLETFADCKEMGRVTLRVGGMTVAAGVITKLE